MSLVGFLLQESRMDSVKLDHKSALKYDYRKWKDLYVLQVEKTRSLQEQLDAANNLIRTYREHSKETQQHR
jgi:hypothetical protein